MLHCFLLALSYIRRCRYSMPWMACARIITDTSDPSLTVTDEILTGLWEWETTVRQRTVIQQLFQAVFDRSAALSGMVVVALASQTERLQPAMGGLTCAIGGSLCARVPTYIEKMRHYINLILGPELGKLVHLHQVEDAALKGAGILAYQTVSKKSR